MKRIRINLGKGVYISAPCKDEMTLDEWRRMTSYINGIIGVPDGRVRVESNTHYLYKEGDK